MISPNSFDSTLLYNALVEELDQDNLKKRLSNNTCSASLFYKGRDSACFCFRGDVHGEGAEGGWDVSIWSFSTCSREQHSQDSFLLLSFSTMLREMFSSFFTCVRRLLLLSSRTHTLFIQTAQQHDTDTAGRRVCGLHRRLIYVVSQSWKTELMRPFIKQSE